MKCRSNIFLLIIASIVVFFVGGICGILIQITPHTVSPFLKSKTRDSLNAMAPGIFGTNFMRSMRLVVAGKYLVGFYPDSTNASLLVVDGKTKRFAFFAPDTAARGIPEFYSFIDLKTKKDYTFLDRNGNGAFGCYASGLGKFTMLDRNADGIFDMRTSNGIKWILMNHEWHPYTITNHMFQIIINNHPEFVTFTNGVWNKRNANTTGSNMQVSDSLNTSDI